MQQNKKIQHLYQRAGFGLRMNEYKQRKDWSIQQAVDELFVHKKNKLELVARTELPFRAKGMTPAMRSENRKIEKNKVLKQGQEWIDRMGNASENALRERMSLFWHGHFACETRIGILAAQYLDTIYEHSLGNFKDLVIAVARTPAMIRYLNNQQNRKNSPNENFARELMELFTIGRGNYTETDVKQAARAFTGWSSDKGGNFIFKHKQHDFGTKNFMGEVGNFDGTDIVDIILKREETAFFICQKVYKYFVNDKVDNELVKKLAEQFYSSNYDISVLMKTIFTSDWFYDEKNIGTKIKSPIELAAGFIRQTGLKTEKPIGYFFIQNKLGQILFKPPNVAGWTGGKAWIDNSTLTMRLNAAQLIALSGANPAIKPQMQGLNRIKKAGLVFDWTVLLSPLEELSQEEILPVLSDYLLSIAPSIDFQFLERFIKIDSREDYIKRVAITLMSLPEYQMC